MQLDSLILSVKVSFLSPQESGEAHALYLYLRLHRYYRVTTLLAAEVKTFPCIYIHIFIKHATSPLSPSPGVWHILLKFSKRNTFLTFYYISRAYSVCSKSDVLPQSHKLPINYCSNSGMRFFTSRLLLKVWKWHSGCLFLPFLCFFFVQSGRCMFPHHKSVVFTSRTISTTPKTTKYVTVLPILVPCLCNDITDCWLINYSNGPFLGKRAL